jgi:hypothetical protein
MQPDAQQHAAYYAAQHSGYQQQWLPAQFAQLALAPGGYGAHAHHGPPAGAAAFAGPPFHTMGMPLLQHALSGAGSGADGSQGQPFVPMQLAAAMSHEPAQPRGWGGVQLHERLDRQRAGYGGTGPGRCACGQPQGALPWSFCRQAVVS